MTGVDSGTAPPPLETADAVFTPVPGRPHTWSYRVRGISLAENADGTGRQLSLVEAGSFAMVSLTTQLELTAKQRDAARLALAELEGSTAARVVLVPAELGVSSAALLLGDGDSVSEPLATSTSSGAHPFSAVFSATLDPAQLDRVKKALAGRRGWLAARYELLVPGGPSSSGSASTATSTEEWTSVVTEGGSVRPPVEPEQPGTSSWRRSTTTSTSTTAPEAAGTAAAAVESIQTDAADWDLSSG